MQHCRWVKEEGVDFSMQWSRWHRTRGNMYCTTHVGERRSLVLVICAGCRRQRPQDVTEKRKILNRNGDCNAHWTIHFPGFFVLMMNLHQLLQVWVSFAAYADYWKPGLGSSSRSSNSHPLISSALYSGSNFASSDSDSDGSRVLSWGAIGESLLEWPGDRETFKERDRFAFSSCSLISIWSTGRGTDSNSTGSLSMVSNRFLTSGSSRLHKL